MKKEKKDKHFIKKPVYPGGLKAMRAFISQELKYPQEAIDHRIEGTVRIRYDIDYKGRVFATHLQNSIGYGCDEEAERLVKLLRFKVDKTRKMKVVFHKSIQINFKLPKEKKIKPKPATPTRINTIRYTYISSNSNSEEDVSGKQKTTSKTYNYTVKIKK